MKEQITRCYNITADLLNNEELRDDVKIKLNEMYELLTELFLEIN